MVGNVVYIIVSHYISNDSWQQNETVHATFDGVVKRLDKIEGLWNLHGFETKRGREGYLEVYNPDGEIKQTYNVLTKTILE